MNRPAALLVSMTLLLAAAGCGSDAATASKPFSCSASQAAAKKKDKTSSATDPKAVAAEVEKRGKPTVTVPNAPVSTLCVIDDIVGAGAAVQPTDSVTVHYVGVGQKSGKQFDASWDRGQTISFPLDGVIKGWTDGLVGMKVGGRRTLVIPGDQAYGASPPTAAIAPNETLVFIIDLVAIG